MDQAVEAARRDTRTIYEDLRRDLTMARFKPGEKLKPSALAQAYGYSANTLREVLLRLSHAGLVVFEEQRGFRTPNASSQRLHDLTVFRVQLEQTGLERSIERGGVEWESQVAAAHHKLRHIEEQCVTPEKLEELIPLWSRGEWEFHDTLLSACESPCLREAYCVTYDQFRQQRVAQADNFGHIKENIREHQRILEAALAHDVEAAKHHVFQHLKRNLLPGQG